MFGQTQTAYEFGPFRLDPQERQLLRNGEVVPLRPKIFDILLVLVQNSGHILSKDDVMKRVWSNTAVEEGNIARNISTLRTVLGEGPREHRYIETIPWRGYRFVANVRELRHAQPGVAIDSIAVIPFVNVSGDPTTEYLSDGIAESLIGNLAQLTNLRVTSRNSAFRYKGSETDVQRIGRELKVQAVLTGRVAERNDLLSVSVELIDASDERYLWGAQYFRKPADVLSVQQTIAREIAEKLCDELSTHSRQLLNKRPTQTNAAYLLYLKGRYHFNKLTLDSVEKAIEYLQQAIGCDPNYALAYAALGDCHNYLAQRDAAKKALLKALELDETLGAAHASIGFFRFLYDWNFAEAEAEFKRALSLNPNYAEAHHWYAIYLANTGRHEEAEQHARLAIELDPLSLLMNMTPALNFYLAREYDKALEQLDKVIEMEPNFVAARSVNGIVLVQQGRYAEALNEYQIVLELIKGATTPEASVKTLMAYAYAISGNRNDALKLLNEGRANTSPYLVAGVCAALGDYESSFEWLGKGYEQRDPQMVSLRVDPMLDGIRGDPRFKDLVNSIGRETIFRSSNN